MTAEAFVLPQRVVATILWSLVVMLIACFTTRAQQVDNMVMATAVQRHTVWLHVRLHYVVWLICLFASVIAAASLDEI